MAAGKHDGAMSFRAWQWRRDSVTALWSLGEGGMHMSEKSPSRRGRAGDDDDIGGVTVLELG